MTSGKQPQKKAKKALISLISTIVIGGFCFVWQNKSQIAEAELNGLFFDPNQDELVILQKNSLAHISNPTDPQPEVVQKIYAVITAYSSTVHETDDTPFITAAGTMVRDGIIANNYLPFGTKIRIPELYGDKIFIIEDRMNWQKSNYHFDIWFPSHNEALNFGAKRTYIEILEG
jgi:3D (Asp-Asp-Asp) domain-containing protein